jgi:ELWxxDGT repeat protein
MNGLYRNDGTATGTIRLWAERLSSIGAMSGAVLFSDGMGLYRTDGTVAGTQLVKSVSAWGLTPHKGVMFFCGDDGTAGFELWRSDGTEAGTTLVKDIFPGGSSSPSESLAVGDNLFFVASNAVYGRELWKTDGTSRVRLTLSRDDSPLRPGAGETGRKIAG